MVDQERPRAVVVTGTPGVGKSTVCRALAERFPLAAHVEADALHRMIVAGGQWPSARTQAAYEQLLLRTRNAATVAANLVDAGVPTFVDEVVMMHEQMQIINGALPDVAFIVLVAERGAVLERDRFRSKQTAAHYLDDAPAILDVVGEAPVVDTTDLDVRVTVDRVLSVIRSRSD